MTRREKLWWYYCAPYGFWCADGRTVLFNRGYHPIVVFDAEHGPHVPASCQLYRRDWQHWDGPTHWDGPHIRAERFEWNREGWFYDDSNPPWLDAETRVRVMLVLADFLDGKMSVPHVRVQQ